MTYGPLGSAQRYQAVIHMQGGQRVWTRVPRLVDVTWGRVLDDYSEASCTVAKRHVDAECAGSLGGVRTWGHELSLYRDGEFVWQGPIVGKSEFGDRFELQARDMIAWFDRRRNVKPYNWTEPTDQNPNGEGAWWVSGILSTVLWDTFEGHADPNLLPYVSIPANTQMATFQAMQTREKSIGDAVRSLIEYGEDMFTIGRQVNILPQDQARARRPLTLTEYDFPSELELREVGLDAVTRAVVIGSQPQNPTSGGSQPASDRAAPIGVWPDPPGGVSDFFGLIERAEKSSTATTQGAVDWLAYVMAQYNDPPAMSIIVPSSSQLSPRAPVSIHDLIPAQRVRVKLLSYHTPAQQEFVINDVQVTASSSGADMQEQVSISVTSNTGPLDGGP